MHSNDFGQPSPPPSPIGRGLGGAVLLLNMNVGNPVVITNPLHTL